MNLGDIAIAAVIASAFTLVVLTLTVYRAALGRAIRGIVDGIRWLRPWHVFAVVFGVVLLFTFLDPHAFQEGLFYLILMVGIAIGFTIAWVHEFHFLMSLRDEDFPGRYDKPIWAFVLLILPPVGLFLFRSHRLAHWPEPQPKPRVTAAARELA